MKLRSKLLALSLLTLLLPWSAWKLLQELEGFLREAQEETLLASARTMAAVIPVGFQTRLRTGEQRRVFRTIPGLEEAEFLPRDPPVFLVCRSGRRSDVAAKQLREAGFTTKNLGKKWYAARELPAVFREIPAAHEKARVLASVPGTPAAATIASRAA